MNLDFSCFAQGFAQTKQGGHSVRAAPPIFVAADVSRRVQVQNMGNSLGSEHR